MTKFTRTAEIPHLIAAQFEKRRVIPATQDVCILLGDGVTLVFSSSETEEKEGVELSLSFDTVDVHVIVRALRELAYVLEGW